MQHQYDGPGESISRADFLRRAAALTTTAGVVAACGSSKSAGSSSTGQGVRSSPRRGGTLQLGMIGAGSQESFDPHLGGLTPIAQVMQKFVYDSLTIIDAKGNLLPDGLATRFEPNRDATEFLIELKTGVTWHDGSPLTADDVVWSLRYGLEPSSYVAPSLGMIDSNGIRKDGAGKVRVRLNRSFARLAPVLAINGLSVIKAGTTKFTKPVGTGPFKLTSFTPGQRSTYTTNTEYWNGAPYADGAKILSFSDNPTMVNALLSQQVNMLPIAPLLAARTQIPNAGFKVYTSEFQSPYVFVMRVDRPPFNDVRVRQALKLLVDRQAMLKVALSGYGTVGNDLLGIGRVLYDTSLPQRAQDIEQAKSLLRQAGRSNLQITLITANAIDGFTELATLYAQQAAKAGVTVQLNTVPANSYFNPGAGFLSRSFGQDLWPVYSLEGVYDETFRATAPLNETHWSSPGWDQMLNRAEAELDLTRATELWRQPQQIQYSHGGYISPVNAIGVAAAASSVQGVDKPDEDWLTTQTMIRAWLSA